MAHITKESLKAKIKRAEDRVAKTGETYDAACKELKNLREKMSAIENEELISAFLKSNKTLEEAIAFFESDMAIEDGTSNTTKCRGRRRKRKTK